MLKTVMTSLLCLILLASSGCTKIVTIPTPAAPPDITKAVAAVAESNMAPEAKAAALKQIADAHQLDLAYMERVYAVEVQRAREAGDSIKSWVAQLLAIAGTAASVTLAAVK